MCTTCFLVLMDTQTLHNFVYVHKETPLGSFNFFVPKHLPTVMLRRQAPEQAPRQPIMIIFITGVFIKRSP